MASEVYNLVTLNVEDTVTRGGRVGYKNNPDTPPLLTVAVEDVCCTGANYLIRSSLSANNLRGYAKFNKNSVVVEGLTGIDGVTGADLIRNDKDNTFYTVTGIQGDSLYLTSRYQGDTSEGLATVRKTKLGSAKFEYLKSLENEDKFIYDQSYQVWRPLGVDMQGPSLTSKNTLEPFPGDGLGVEFQESEDINEPDLTTVKSVYKTLVSKTQREIRDLSLSPIPYPHDNLKVYFGPDNDIQLKEENKDYFVNYSSDPDLKIPRPPYEDRQVAYIKFLGELDDVAQVEELSGNFPGIFSITKREEIPESPDLLTPIQDVIPGTEEIKIGGVSQNRYSGYDIDYPSGNVTFVQHQNSELLTDNITYSSNLIWDGVSIVRGVTKDQVVDESNLIVSPIAGLPGITGVVYFEDNDSNALVKNTDYILEYGTGAISIETDLRESDSLLLSYFVEGEDEEKEELPLTNIKTDKFPIQPDTFSLVKKWVNTETQKSGTTVLVEGVDFEIFYLTGKIKLLRVVEGEEIRSLQATYTPLTQINTVIQPTESPGTYRFTVIDDILDTLDASNLRFYLRNPSMSIPTEDPFKEAGDPNRYSFNNDIEEFLSLKIQGQEGFGFKNYTDDQMFAIGLTGLVDLGIADALGTTPQQVFSMGLTGLINSGVKGTVGFSLEDVTYDGKTKEIQVNKPENSDVTVDLNDVALATYRYSSDTIPYAPVIPFFPIFSEGADSFVVEGFDKTDVIRPGMIIRIDNFDPENTYYFRVQSSSFDGDNTAVAITSTFPEDITNPSFFLFDDYITWESIPNDTEVDRSSIIGSTELRFRNNPLAVLNQMRNDKILMINDSHIHTILSAEVDSDDSNIINVTIFPALQESPRGTIVVSNTPVYVEGEIDLSAEYSILLDPEEPAFRISFNAPEGYEGAGAIAIDTEKIVLRENIEGIINPNSYEYKFNDYVNIRQLAEAIENTESTFPNIDSRIPSYRPFTFNPGGLEEYYLPSSNYDADLVIPFEEGEIAFLPYMIRIVPELYKWKLISAYKNRKYFDVDDANRTDLFPSGDLVAFKSREDGSNYYFEVDKSEYDSKSNPVKTTVTLKDTIRDNFINPYLYKFGNPNWIEVPDAITQINREDSKITFSADLSKVIKTNSLLRVDESYIYSVRSVEIDSGSTILTLSPSINLNLRNESFFNYIQVSEVPVILDGVTRQPNFTITYQAIEGHVGKGYVEITEEYLKLTEVLDGTGISEKKFVFSDYTNIVKLVNDIDSYDGFNIWGYSPFSATVTAYEDELKAGKFDVYSLQQVAKSLLPYNVKVAKSTFEINYTSPTGYSTTANVVFFSDRMDFVESSEDLNPSNPPNPDPVSKTTSITYLGKSVYTIINEINSIDSIIAGNKPFSVDTRNTESYIGRGSFGTYSIVGNPEEVSLSSPYRVKVVIKEDAWTFLSRINENRLVVDEDYVVEGGSLTLTDPLERGDRFRFNYLGLDTLPESDGESITCSCKFVDTLPEGYRVDVYMDYLNIDQFYLQTLTERFFLEIVTVPQVEQILRIKTGGGGNGADTGNNGEIPVYQGGAVNDQYRLRDEQIKQQLYLKVFDWYKERRRFFASEAQLIMGFKYGNCPHVVYENGQFTISDSAVEGPEYSLITDSDIEQINNGFSRFFPVGYDGSAPLYLDRFGDTYRSYNEVYPYNIRYVYEDEREDVLEGRVKSIKPFWNKDLDYEILSNESNTVVSPYDVPIEEYDKTFYSDDKKTNFLKRVYVGDSFRLETKKTQYTIACMGSGTDKETGDIYETLIMEEGKYFTEEGIRTITIHVDINGNKKFKTTVRGKEEEVSFTEFESALGGLGSNIIISTNNPAFFPAYDDNFNIGAKIEGKQIDGKIRNKDYLLKFPWKDILAALIPLLEEPRENFRVQSGYYNEDSLSFVPEETITIELSRLDFFDEFNLNSIRRALYDNIEGTSLAGLSKYFYLSLEKVYSPNSEDGYLEGFVLRSKDRKKAFRFLLTDGEDVADQYGFTQIDEDTGNSILYNNFYDPNNMYRWLLREQQAWLTEEAMIRDLFDTSDKIARAFQDGNVNGAVSRFKNYLVTVGGALASRIPKYRDHLLYLTGQTTEPGPVKKIIEEVSISETGELSFASPAIRTSYEEAAGKTGVKGALQIYQDFLNEQSLAISVNSTNVSVWNSDYIRWVLSLNEGILFQKEARRQKELLDQDLDIGFLSFDAINVSYNPDPQDYELSNPKYGVYSVANLGPSLVLQIDAENLSDPEDSGLRNFFFPFSEYPTLGSLVSAINTQSVLGSESLFIGGLSFVHHPFGEYSSERLLFTNALLDMAAASISLQVSNVPDHRDNDSRVLFLNGLREDQLVLDNSEQTAIDPFLTYVSNGDVDKKFLDDLEIKVPGRWARNPQDFPDGYFNVIEIGPYNSNWSISYRFEDVEESGTTRSEITTPDSDIIKYNQSDRVDIDESTWETLLARGNRERPDVFILKKLILTKNGGTNFSKEFDLRRYETINQLIDAINLATDDTGNRLFSSSLVGDKDIQGAMKSYEFKAEYERQVLRVLVGVDVDPTDVDDVQYYMEGFPVGWELPTKNLRVGQSVTLQINPKRYSPLTNYTFIPEEPEQARNTILSRQQVDVLPFDLYCWDDNAFYRVEYSISGDSVQSNNLILQSAGVSCTIPLKENELLYDYSGAGNGLINRINSNPNCNKFWYANLKFGRENQNNFVYTYLPAVTLTPVPKATLEELYLGQDTALTITSEGENFEYQVVPVSALPSPIDPDTVYEAKEISLEADIGAIQLSLGDGYTSNTSGTYNLDGTGETLTIETSYEYDYSYEKTFDLSSYTLNTLISAIDAEADPVTTTNLFNASLGLGVSGSSSASILIEQSGLLPGTLQKTGTPSDAVLISVITPGPSYTVNSASYSVSDAGILTISATIRYSGTYNPPVFNLTNASYDTLQELTTALGNLKPESVFNPLFSTSLLVSDAASTNLLDSGGDQAINETSFLRIVSAKTYSITSGTLQSIASTINNDSTSTGFSATVLNDYSTYPAKFLIPSNASSTAQGSVTLSIDLRNFPGLLLLNMDSPATYKITGSGLNKSLEVIKDNNVTTFSITSRNLEQVRTSLLGDITSGLQEIGIVPYTYQDDQFGLLNNVSTADLPVNSPTSSGAHVYLGFLSDIRFYQISDKNLDTQLSYIKRRLAKPWKDSEGDFIPDYYNSDNYYNFEYGISRDQFLSYLRDTRFTQLANSIVNEDLNNNAYLWLYLKFHKEFGCDQQVKLLKKKVKEDEEAGEMLRLIDINP